MTLTPTQLAARAAYVLRDNATGTMTKAAPRLYPHQWSWDAAFVAMGLAAVDVPRACAELDTLLHIGVDAAQGYFVAKPAITLPRTRLPRPTAVLTDAPAAAPSIGAPGLTAAATNLHEDDEGLARRLLEAVLDRTGMETSYLTVLDAATGGLEHRYVRNTSDLVIPEGTVVPWEQTLCKRCRDARIRWTADVPAELPGGHAAEALGVTTFLSIPVRQPDGAVIGTLCAASRERRYIAASTLDDLEELARQLGRRIAAPVTSSALHGGPGIDRGATAPR